MAEAAFRLSNGMDVQYLAALALAIAGKPANAPRVMNNLAGSFLRHDRAIDLFTDIARSHRLRQGRL